MGQNSGYLVKTKHGLKGRTYNDKPKINGKTQVFIELSINTTMSIEPVKYGKLLYYAKQIL